MTPTTAITAKIATIITAVFFAFFIGMKRKCSVLSCEKNKKKSNHDLFLFIFLSISLMRVVRI